eukprot:c4986_g1_i1.p1 GENE.c4986_g1_i1~~c4986_g1_i1.p1  ORF type:complete len:159 (-),score=29.87 c4986_g1_i1:243-692(-)
MDCSIQTLEVELEGPLRISNFLDLPPLVRTLRPSHSNANKASQALQAHSIQHVTKILTRHGYIHGRNKAKAQRLSQMHAMLIAVRARRASLMGEASYLELLSTAQLHHLRAQIERCISQVLKHRLARAGETTTTETTTTTNDTAASDST